MNARPRLGFADIDAFDPYGPPGRKWCPLCGNGKPKDAAHRCLSVDRTGGWWKCFRCGAAGKASGVGQSNDSMTRLEGYFSLSSESPVQLPESLVQLSDSSVQPSGSSVHLSESSVQSSESLVHSSESSVHTDEAAPLFDWRAAWERASGLEQTRGERYLQKRGVLAGVAARAGARFCGQWKSGPSVLFPLLNRAGGLAAVQGRSVRGSAKITYGSKKEGAFLAPATLAPGHELAPLSRQAPAVILTEAPIDALSLAACGFPALALCGTSGPSWLHLACGLRRVALAFDADDAGERAAHEHTAHLSMWGAGCFRLRPEHHKDWNEMLLGWGREDLSDWLAAQILTA